MAIRGDRDPTDLGLLSEAETADVIEMRTRRRVPAPRRGRSQPADPQGPSRSIGPATPPAGGGSERVREHMDRIYAERGWVRETPEETRQRKLREARREQQRR